MTKPQSKKEDNLSTQSLNLEKIGFHLLGRSSTWQQKGPQVSDPELEKLLLVPQQHESSRKSLNLLIRELPEHPDQAKDFP